MNTSEIREKLKSLLDETGWEDLDTLWYLIGVCPRCHQLIEHHIDEPFASCACGTGEDTGGPTFLQQLKHKQSGTHSITRTTKRKDPKDLLEVFDQHERVKTDEDFVAFMLAADPKKWAKFDASACAVGWEAAKMLYSTNAQDIHPESKP